MVQVPRNPTRSVQSRAPSPVFQSSEVPSGAFGDGGAATAASAKGLGAFADDIGKVVLQMQIEDNETKAKEADARIASRIRSVMLGDPDDPEGTPGYLMTKGKTSVEALGPAEERIRAIVAEETEAAGRNRHLTRLISDAASRRVNTALDRAVGHANEQRLAHQEQTSLAREVQALADASADWQDPKAIQNSLGIVAAEVTDRAEAQGMSPEAAQAMLMQRQSIIVKGAFDAALASQDVMRAQAIFSANADKLDGPTRTTMAQALATDVLEVQSQKLASEAFSKFKNDPAAGRAFIDAAVDGKQQSAAMAEYQNLLENMRGDARFAIALAAARRAAQAEQAPAVAQSIAEEAIAAVGEDASVIEQQDWVRQNYSGQEEQDAVAELAYRAKVAATVESRAREEANHKYALQQRAIAEVDHEYKVEKRRREEAQREARQSGYAAIDSGQTVREWRAANPGLYDTLAAEDDIRGLVATERAVAEGNLYATASDGQTLSNLLTKYSTSELAQIVPVQYRRSLTESEYSRLITAVTSAKKVREADATQRQVYNVGERALRGFAPKTMLDSEGGRGTFRSAKHQLEQWISGRMEAGKEPTTPEIEAEAARLMMRVESDLGFFTNDFEGIAAQAKEMTPEERATATVSVDQIPDQIIDRIMGNIKAFDPTFERGLIPDNIMEQIAGALAVGDIPRYESLIQQMLNDKAQGYGRTIR